MVIQSYAYVENLLNLSWHVDPPNFPIGSNAEIKLNDMVITSTAFEKCDGPYPMFRGYGNWSCVKGFIVMKRLIVFHVIQTYVPTAMLVWISWMSFWLDPRASPARITLTITTLLTLTTMSNGARQDLPQVAYIKMLDLWLSFNQGLIFLVLLEYAFVSYYLTKRNFDCIHRRPISSSPSLQDGKEMKKRPESPIIGLSTGTPLLHSNGNAAAIHGNGCYLRQRHASMDSGHPRLCQQNSNFSVTAGCVNSTT
uniref:Neurotransmitter-gated ion-channel transmembrane domain-containing protein n=1 Tax=Panagrolaimus sp. JU765 TaxID=591449 RepID=A0AC34R6A8_9BILA